MPGAVFPDTAWPQVSRARLEFRRMGGVHPSTSPRQDSQHTYYEAACGLAGSDKEDMGVWKSGVNQNLDNINTDGIVRKR